MGSSTAGSPQPAALASARHGRMVVTEASRRAAARRAAARRTLPLRKGSGKRSDWWAWSRMTLDPLRDKVVACRSGMREAASKCGRKRAKKAYKGPCS